MDATYRQNEVTNARQELAKWRAIYDAQPSFNKSKRTAAEQMEFWGSKLALMSQANPIARS